MESHGAWKAGRWHKPFFMDQPGAFGATQWCEASAAEEGEHCHASAESSSTQCGLFLAEQRMRKASLFGPALSLFLFPVSPFFFFFFLPPQEQMQSAKSHQKACITSGKLSLLTLWASPQGRTTGGRLQGKIGLLKWQFIVNHFSKLLIEALSVREEGDLSFCPSRTLMTP